MRCWVHEAPEIIVQILCISIFFCRYVFHRRSALMFRDTSERCVCTIAICHTDIKKHTRSKRSKRMRAVTHTHTHTQQHTWNWVNTRRVIPIQLATVRKARMRCGTSGTLHTFISRGNKIFNTVNNQNKPPYGLSWLLPLCARDNLIWIACKRIAMQIGGVRRGRREIGNKNQSHNCFVFFFRSFLSRCAVSLFENWKISATLLAEGTTHTHTVQRSTGACMQNQMAYDGKSGAILFRGITITID